ncbi:MAG: class I SAM-dependent methyltransferase [Patescibacteria group bacterium]
MWLTLTILVIFIVIASAAWAGFHGAPWVPTWAKDFNRVRGLAALQATDTVYELGAGEGRLLKVFAATSARTIVGFELSFLPFLIAKVRFWNQRPRVQVKCQDFFHVDFHPATVIFCFLTPPAMRKLKEKFEAECRPGTRIISYAFSIPGWTPEVTDKPAPSAMTIYRYVVPPRP